MALKITVPQAKLCLRTTPPQVTVSLFVPVYTATLQPVMMSIDDVVAIARGPPL